MINYSRSLINWTYTSLAWVRAEGWSYTLSKMRCVGVYYWRWIRTLISPYERMHPYRPNRWIMRTEGDEAVCQIDTKYELMVHELLVPCMFKL